MNNGFFIQCKDCGSQAQISLATDYDIAIDGCIAAFTLFCPACGQIKSTGKTTPRIDLVLNAKPQNVSAVATEIAGE